MVGGERKKKRRDVDLLTFMDICFDLIVVSVFHPANSPLAYEHAYGTSFHPKQSMSTHGGATQESAGHKGFLPIIVPQERAGRFSPKNQAAKAWFHQDLDPYRYRLWRIVSENVEGTNLQP